MKLYHGQYRLECMECDLATLLVEKRGLTIRKALSVLYDSETYRLLQKPNTGLFFQSPHYVYSYLQEEMDGGWRKRSIPTHSGWLYPLTFDAEKGLKEA